jgi:hypothetical protein
LSGARPVFTGFTLKLITAGQSSPYISAIVFATHSIPNETPAAAFYAVNASRCPLEASDTTRAFL